MLERALSEILSLADGGSAHFFVVSGCQEAEIDPHKLALTHKLLEAVLGEAKACGTGLPVAIIGDFSAVAHLDGAFADGRGVQPSPTCKFDFDGAAGTRRDCFLVCLNALVAGTACI